MEGSADANLDITVTGDEDESPVCFSYTHDRWLTRFVRREALRSRLGRWTQSRCIPGGGCECSCRGCHCYSGDQSDARPAGRGDEVIEDIRRHSSRHVPYSPESALRQGQASEDDSSFLSLLAHLLGDLPPMLFTGKGTHIARAEQRCSRRKHTCTTWRRVSQILMSHCAGAHSMHMPYGFYTGAN